MLKTIVTDDILKRNLLCLIWGVLKWDTDLHAKTSEIEYVFLFD